VILDHRRQTVGVRRELNRQRQLRLLLRRPHAVLAQVLHVVVLQGGELLHEILVHLALVELADAFQWYKRKLAHLAPFLLPSIPTGISR